MQKTTTAAAKALIIGFIMIAISLVIAFTQPAGNSDLQWVIYCTFFLGIIISVYVYGKQINHNSTFGNYFAHGFKISAIITILMIAFLVIFISAYPEYKDKAIDAARKSVESKSNTSADQKEKIIDMTKKFFMVFLIGGALVGYLLIGAVASLIGAAVTKKEPRVLQEEHINQIGS